MLLLLLACGAAAHNWTHATAAELRTVYNIEWLDFAAPEPAHVRDGEELFSKAPINQCMLPRVNRWIYGAQSVAMPLVSSIGEQYMCYLPELADSAAKTSKARGARMMTRNYFNSSNIYCHKMIVFQGKGAQRHPAELLRALGDSCATKARHFPRRNNAAFFYNPIKMLCMIAPRYVLPLHHGHPHPCTGGGLLVV